MIFICSNITDWEMGLNPNKMTSSVATLFPLQFFDFLKMFYLDKMTLADNTLTFKGPLQQQPFFFNFSEKISSLFLLLFFFFLLYFFDIV